MTPVDGRGRRDVPWGKTAARSGGRGAGSPIKLAAQPPAASGETSCRQKHEKSIARGNMSINSKVGTAVV